MLSDFQYSLRQLSKSRILTLTAILTLAVGIGASTAMFSGLRAVALKPFDYPDSESLVQIWSGDDWPLSAPDYFDLYDQSSSFSAFGIYNPFTANVGIENPHAAFGARVNADVLNSLGIEPLLGRLFLAEDDLEGSAPVAIISHALWTQLFGQDETLIGQTTRIDGNEVTIVGIMPKGFEFASPWMRFDECEIWMPHRLTRDSEERYNHNYIGIARIRNDVTFEEASQDIAAIGTRLSELHPNENSNKRFLVRTLREEIAAPMTSKAWLLFGSVILVLLIACANVGSMLLSRGAQRQNELSVRVSIGAKASDILRLTLTESVVIAIFGSLAGLAIAYANIEFLKAAAPLTEARKGAIAIDGPVIAFAIGATLFSAIATCLPPLLSNLRSFASPNASTDPRGTTISKDRRNTLRSLVIAQVTIAFVLANGAALLSSSYKKLMADNQVFDTEHVLSAKINLTTQRYETEESRIQFWEQLDEKVEAIPGVMSASVSSKLPMNGGSSTNALVNDDEYDPSRRGILVERTSATPGYFETMGLKLLQGRTLLPQDDSTEAENANTLIVGVVVNEAMVKQAWPDTNPIGQKIRGNNPGDPWFIATVVGVVEDIRQWGPTEDVKAEMYMTPVKHWGNQAFITFRSNQAAASLEPQLKEALASLDSELALENVRTLKTLITALTMEQRMLADMVNIFMFVSLGLVAVGLYGTLSYHIQNRAREIGVRLSIGAKKSDIVNMVLKQGLAWVGLGSIIGFAAICALAALLESIVYGMEGLTAQPVILATLAVGVSSVIACWIPARRVQKLDPMQILRAD